MNLKLIDSFDLIDESSEEVVIMLEHFRFWKPELTLRKKMKKSDQLLEMLGASNWH